MLQADQTYRANQPSVVQKDVEILTGVQSPGPNGVQITIGDAAVSQDLWAVDSMVGQFEALYNYTQSQFETLAREKGAGTQIDTSISRSGIIRDDGNNLFKLRIGPDLADSRKFDEMRTSFRNCLNRLLENSVDGYVPVP